LHTGYAHKSTSRHGGITRIAREIGRGYLPEPSNEITVSADFSNLRGDPNAEHVLAWYALVSYDFERVVK
jgi:hypothetical protein